MTTRLMTARLHPLASRGLALAILVLLAGLAYAALIAPLLEDYATTQQQIVQYTVLAERYRRLAEVLPSRRAALAASLMQLAKCQQWDALPLANAAISHLRSTSSVSPLYPRTNGTRYPTLP